MDYAHDGLKPQPLAGPDLAITIAPEAEDRIAFYRGMAQAFSAASASRQKTANADFDNFRQ
jgi:penicillin-binding protein 1A